jgi:hypothetical protein
MFLLALPWLLLLLFVLLTHLLLLLHRSAGLLAAPVTDERQTKIGHFGRHARIHKHVLALEIAVDDACMERMKIVHALRNAHCKRKNLARVQRLQRVLQNIKQGAALTPFCDHENVGAGRHDSRRSRNSRCRVGTCDRRQDGRGRGWEAGTEVEDNMRMPQLRQNGNFTLHVRQSAGESSCSICSALTI